MSARTLANNAATYGTFSKESAPKEGDTASADAGVPHGGPYGDNVPIPFRGKTSVDV